MLLTRARSEAVRGAGSLADVAAALQPAMRDAIVLTRNGAARRGIERLINEADSLGADVTLQRGASGFFQDWLRADGISRSYSARWLRSAEETSSATKANAATQGSLGRIAVTESSQAFNESRLALLDDIRRAPDVATVTELMRVWDATLDRATCPVCEDADGTIVGLNESFPDGEPSGVHPNCRCTFTLIGVTLKG